MMSRVKNADTKPEITVRKLLHRMGYRFRLHDRKLPGSPDIVLPKYKTAVFVHGCFWHGHTCSKGRRPTSRVEFWNAKLDKNVERDASVRQQLETLGWRVLVVWECQVKDEEYLSTLLRDFFNGTPFSAKQH